jgi:poly(3-hydroxybutyrate) depolymerase
MIRLLPPPEAAAKRPEKGDKLQAMGVSYHIQLPPGYNHGRPWPVLMVLHHSQEKAEEELERWSDLAAQRGYILVAPQWTTGLKVPYGFSAKEHAAVLEALKDVRRKFQVDSDRVFLFGVESGGQPAFDIALSHPDQFAGALPMAARPDLYIPRYWPNAQYLHLYVVNGEFLGQAHKAMHNMCQEWIKHHYPAIYVEYKGRAADGSGRRWN